MLNPTFSKIVEDSLKEPYVAPESIASHNLKGNESIVTGPEQRLQPIYGEEIWLKLERAGISPSLLQKSSILEVCAGTGFLTYHLLSKINPKSYTLNDISASELSVAKELIDSNYPNTSINWVLGDIHTTEFNQKFDVIIGNSFIHHFHNVPQVLSRFQSMLNSGGIFISLHEPTPMSTIVEGAKILAYPLAVIAPILVNNIARARYKGEPSATDLWIFQPSILKKVALKTGFSKIEIQSWNLLRPITVQRNGLHLSSSKSLLSNQEARMFHKAIKIDSYLNRILSHRFFGSVCLVCRK